MRSVVSCRELLRQWRETMVMKWLRKKHLRQRYGDCSDRSIERAVKDKRLPPPEYPFGNRVPAWNEAVLDEHDRATVLASHPKRDADPPDGHSREGGVSARRRVA
jgi:hypothetical protein